MKIIEKIYLRKIMTVSRENVGDEAEEKAVAAASCVASLSYVCACMWPCEQKINCINEMEADPTCISTLISLL